MRESVAARKRLLTHCHLVLVSPKAKDAHVATDRMEGESPTREFCISGVQLRIVGEDLGLLQEFPGKLRLSCRKSAATSTSGSAQPETSGGCVLLCFRNGKDIVYELKVSKETHVYQGGTCLVLMRVPQGSAVVKTETTSECSQLVDHLSQSISEASSWLENQSVFNLRTEEASAKQYFQFYGYLSQQQNMMQDYVRTATYQSAMLQNTADFQGKVVLDVGAGSGILSFFAVQAGAKKVYAVEASSMAIHCMELVESNGLADKIVLIAGKIEEVDIPEKVDLIVSEPMGYMLFNERMLESYTHSRKWLKPGGKMYPTQAILYAAPFTDEALYIEQYSKANFWSQTHFHGVNVSSLKESALDEYYKQPVVDTFDVRILMAKPIGHTVNFNTTNESDLHRIMIPVKFQIQSTGCCHGLAFWFDVSFIGSQSTVWLSTAPYHPLTHWYQIRCLLRTPLMVHAGQELTGHVRMIANERQSYDVDIELAITGTGSKSANSYDLKNPNFRYTGMGMCPPPGTHHTNPTESYWNNLQGPQEHNGQQQQTVPLLSTSQQEQHQHHSQNQTCDAGTLGIGMVHQPVAMVNGGFFGLNPTQVISTSGGGGGISSTSGSAQQHKTGAGHWNEHVTSGSRGGVFGGINIGGGGSSSRKLVQNHLPTVSGLQFQQSQPISVQFQNQSLFGVSSSSLALPYQQQCYTTTSQLAMAYSPHSSPLPFGTTSSCS